MVPFTVSSIPFEKNEVDWNEFLNRDEERPDYVRWILITLSTSCIPGTTGCPIHCSWSRRNPYETPHRTALSRRCETGRPAILLHYLRLDDVELVDQWTRLWSMPCPLRRISSFPGMDRMWKLIDDEQITISAPARNFWEH